MFNKLQKQASVKTNWLTVDSSTLVNCYLNKYPLRMKSARSSEVAVVD